MHTLPPPRVQCARSYCIKDKTEVAMPKSKRARSSSGKGEAAEKNMVSSLIGKSSKLFFWASCFAVGYV